MKPVLAAILVLLLLAGATACGSGSGAATRASNGGQSVVKKRDRDNDGDNNDDDAKVLAFGQVPGAAEQKTITKLVNDYFAAAVAMDGRKGCALLTPLIAESVVESYGRSTNLRGSTCAEVVSKLYRLRHAELVRKVATLKVMRIGVEGNRSLVALEVPSIQEDRQVTLRNSGGKWTMLTLLDGNIE